MQDVKNTQSSPPPHLAMDLLGDLQNRLEALKNWQTQSEEHAEKLREQSRSIEEEREHLEQRQQEIDRAWEEFNQQKQSLANERGELESKLGELEESRAQLERDREAFQKAHDAFETERAEMEELLKTEQDDLQARRLQLEQELKSQQQAVEKDRQVVAADRSQVEARQTQLDEAFAKLRADEAGFEQRQQQFSARIEQVENEHKQITAQRVQIEAERKSLQQQIAQLDQRKQQLDTRAGEIEALRQQVEDERAQFAEREKQLAEHEKQIAAEKQELRKSREQLNRVQIEQQLRADALGAQEASLVKAREELVQRASEAASLGVEDGDLASALTEARSKLDEERHRIQKAEAQLKELRGKFDQREKEATDLRRQLEQRSKELAQFDEQVKELRASTQQLENDKQQALSERDAALARKPVANDFDPGNDNDATLIMSAAAPAAGNAADHPNEEFEHLLGEIQERDQQLQALRTQIKQREQELEKARKRINDLSAQLETLREKIESQADAAERATALEEELTDRNEKIDELSSNLDARLDEIKLLRERIEQLSQNTDSDGGEGIEGEALQRRAAELEEQAAQIAADRERIQQRKDQLKQADDVIRKRREKLRNYIAAMRERGVLHEDGDDPPVPTGSGTAAIPVASVAMSASDAAKIAGIERDRKQLTEVKQFLQQSEAAMVKRWATYESAWVVGVMLCALSLMAGASYLAGHKIAIPEYQATMALQVTPAPDETDLPAGAWIAGYRRAILDLPVMEEVNRQLDQQGIRLAPSPAALAEHFSETLKVEGEPQRVVLRYVGEDVGRLGEILDAYGKGLMRWHLIEDNKTGRLDTAKVLDAARAQNKPIKDERLIYSGVIFGGLIVLGLLLYVPIRLMNGRSKPLLNEDAMPKLELSTLDKPETWSPVAVPVATVEPDPNDGMGSPDDTISNYR